MNTTGHRESLTPAPIGNTRALKHGLFSARREITSQVEEIAAELMALPHVVDSDYPAAIEVAKLVVLIDRVDAALADGRVERRGSLRTLVDQRRRLSAQLERWYARFFLHPAARMELARLARPTFAQALEDARRREIEKAGNGQH